MKIFDKIKTRIPYLIDGLFPSILKPNLKNLGKYKYSFCLMLTPNIILLFIAYFYYEMAKNKIIRGDTKIPETINKLINLSFDGKFIIEEAVLVIAIIFLSYFCKNEFLYQISRLLGIKFPLWYYFLAVIILASRPIVKLNIIQSINVSWVAIALLLITGFLVYFFPRNTSKHFWD